ncbi:C40 family peptidase [Candidatus Falkowbacteria bacterium]|nr:C40 family peptidase [Candidatus Falkowbacteria bacterium]
MKYSPKKILLLFFIIPAFFSVFYPAQASDVEMPNIKNPTDSLQIKIPGMQRFSEPAQCGDNMCNNWIWEYIAGLYNYAVAVIGIIATVGMMFGGLLWLTSAGNATRISEAKAWIGGSITGLVLMMASYTVLQQINPAIINGTSLEIKIIEKYNLGDTEDSLDSGMTTTASTAKLLQSGSVADIVASAVGKVTYGLNSTIKPGDCFGKGGQGPNGTICFDCSGFAAYVLKSSKNISINGGTGTIFSNTAIKKYDTGTLGSLPEGTLVGWKQGDNGKTFGHVLISLGNGRYADSHGNKARTPGGAIGIYTAAQVNKMYGSNGLRVKQY